MKCKVFDTPFETSLRVILLLNEVDSDKSSDYIQAIDFISLYSHYFGFEERNLNGNNPFLFCEYTSRRNLIKEALRLLTLKGYVQPTAMDSGFLYRITTTGRNFASSLDTTFADKYRKIVGVVLIETSDIDETTLISKLNDKALDSEMRFR